MGRLVVALLFSGMMAVSLFAKQTVPDFSRRTVPDALEKPRVIQDPRIHVGGFPAMIIKVQKRRWVPLLKFNPPEVFGPRCVRKTPFGPCE